MRTLPTKDFTNKKTIYLMRSHVLWHCEILDLLEKLNLLLLNPVCAVEKAVSGSAGGDGFKRKQVKSDVSLKPAILEAGQEDCFVFEDSLGNLVLLYFGVLQSDPKKRIVLFHV